MFEILGTEYVLTLPLVSHADAVAVVLDNLPLGLSLFFRVIPRNLNAQGFVGAAVSNVVEVRARIVRHFQGAV